MGEKRKPPEPKSCTVLYRRTLMLEGVCSAFKSCKVSGVYYFGGFCSDGVSPLQYTEYGYNNIFFVVMRVHVNGRVLIAS